MGGRRNNNDAVVARSYLRKDHSGHPPPLHREAPLPGHAHHIQHKTQPRKNQVRRQAVTFIIQLQMQPLPQLLHMLPSGLGGSASSSTVFCNAACGGHEQGWGTLERRDQALAKNNIEIKCVLVCVGIHDIPPGLPSSSCSARHEKQARDPDAAAFGHQLTLLAPQTLPVDHITASDSTQF